MLTEEEAKVKECRVGGVTLTRRQPASDTYPAESEGYFPSCIGSGCMAWEWETRRPVNATSGEVYRGRCAALPSRDRA